MAGLAALFLLILSVRRDLQKADSTFTEVIKQSAAQEFGQDLLRSYVPVIAYAQRGEKERSRMSERQIAELMPLYGYGRELVRAEAPDLRDGADFHSQEDAQMQQSTKELLMEDLSIEELLRAENEAAITNLQEGSEMQQSETDMQPAAFVPHALQNAVDLQTLADYETLIGAFYTIDKNTMAGSDQLNVASLLGKDLRISKEGEEPQILIYHTHSQEGFADSVPGDASTTIMGVGERLSEILTNRYGYRVLHHMGQYDVDSRDDAYAKSLPDIERVLAENPSIQVVIDLHRDSMPEETRLVMDLDGRPTARFMFFNGLSRTKKTGNISYLYNEYQEDNLAFSFQMQLKATEFYPGLTRKIYLKGYRYNMHLRPRTTLIELGAQNNTLEEALNACDPLAHILDMVLSGT